jgi:hypothetical protein
VTYILANERRAEVMVPWSISMIEGSSAIKKSKLPVNKVSSGPSARQGI